MAECLVLCDMGLEELTEMQLRCQSLAEQCETLENLGQVIFFLGLVRAKIFPCKIIFFGSLGAEPKDAFFGDGVWHSGASAPFSLKMVSYEGRDGASIKT